MAVESSLNVNPDITFVCCIESGALEAQTVRLVESLRRWGGQFANAPIVAVQPRLGPPISKKTLQTFESLQVEYLSIRPHSRYSWFSYMNKPHALVAVEERTTSEYIAWLDSDLLFLKEPQKLLLEQGKDFAACASDKNIGTTGSDDVSEPYWKEICQVVGIELEDLPWLNTQMDCQRIRLYWNSGLFVYRRKTSFGKCHLETSMQLLDSRLAHHQAGFYFTDQIALGLAMVKMGLPWSALPYSYNYQISTLDVKTGYNQEQLKEVVILHYHDAMWPNSWPQFIKCMGETHPAVADWLAPLGPLKNETHFLWRSSTKILKSLRSQKEAEYEKLCRVI